MTSTTSPDHSTLLHDVADHRRQAQQLLGQTGHTTHAPTRIQAALAHAMTGLLIATETAVTALLGAQQPRRDATATTAWVRVFHNNENRTWYSTGYQDGQAVTLVFAFPRAEPADGSIDDLTLAEGVFTLLSTGEDPASGTTSGTADLYARLGNRPPAVADVIAIGERYFSCDEVDWHELDAPPRVDQHAKPGTVPLM